jgi:cytochrome c oxidase subunit III
MSNTTDAVHVKHRDDVGARMGMWLFLFTELLLFGGLFLVYAVYRHEYTAQFRVAAMALNTEVGALNTIILLTSSLTVALSIGALQKGNRMLAIMLLVITDILAVSFLINKSFEWAAKIHHGIYPGSEHLLSLPNGQIMFYGLYYIMTGLHGLHVIIGVVFITIVLGFIITGSVNKDSYVKLENAGLYWHLVDLIWIFLFPLFYLIQ